MNHPDRRGLRLTCPGERRGIMGERLVTEAQQAVLDGPVHFRVESLRARCLVWGDRVGITDGAQASEIAGSGRQRMVDQVGRVARSSV